MEYIYSKIDPNKLLHVINKKGDITETRNDIIPSDKFLNIASFKLNNGKKFNPHKHTWNENKTYGNKKIANESWCIIQGSVLAILYDIDNKVLREVILRQGDLSWSWGEGGHNYKCLEDDTIVYEFKSAPYYGVNMDKILINE